MIDVAMTALEPLRPPKRVPVVPSAVLGTLMFVVAEVMFFTGVLSAFTIIKAGQLPGMWPPPGQPALPAAQAAWNTAALLLSGGGLFLSQRARAAGRSSALGLAVAAWLLGALFVGLQGAEWVALFRAGLTMTSSSLGSFFYLIVGAHGLHVLVALAALGLAVVRMQRRSLGDGYFHGVQTFWYFVVVLWPIIYARVYF